MAFDINIFSINFSNNKKIKQNEIQEFKNFLKKVENDMNNCLLVFLKANGYSYKELCKSKKDLDVVFKDNADYKEFIEIIINSRIEIEKILYTSDISIISKKMISDNVYNLKFYIKKKYPNVKTSEKITKNNYSILKFILWFIFFLFILSLFDGTKPDNTNISKFNNEQKSLLKILLD